MRDTRQPNGHITIKHHDQAYLQAGLEVRRQCIDNSLLPMTNFESSASD